MKKYQSAALSILAMSALACNENINEGTVWDDPNFLRVTVSSEPIGEKEISWARTDEIMVFDRDGAGIRLQTTDNETTAIFYTHEWNANTPGYACYPVNAGNVTCTPEGILGMHLGAEQEISSLQAWGKDAIISAGKITGNSTAYRINPMKNIMGLIELSMHKPAAKSIKVEPIGDEIMAGDIDIDYTRLENGNADFWSAAAGKSQSASVTIVPAAGSEAVTEDGCFKAGTYYVSVLPQTYSEGLRITVTYSDGSTLVRKLGADEGITVPRNGIVAFGEALDDTLPDEIKIDLVFYNENDVNPFGTFTPTKDQKPEGETYIWQYGYETDGQKHTEDLEFIISKGASGATYRYFKPSDIEYQVLTFAQNFGWIKLPGISDRYLKSVTMSHGNTYDKQFRLQEKSSKDTPGKTYSCKRLKAPSATEPIDANVTFPTQKGDFGTLTNTEIGKSYYMMFTMGASLRVFRISLVYTKTEPGTETEGQVP